MSELGSSSVPAPRVLSGMRPTGKLHLGNYMGALANWVKLQDKYECYFFIADWHALTTDYADPCQIAQEHRMMWRSTTSPPASTPNESVLFVQSHVPQHAELHLLLGMSHAARVAGTRPSYKEHAGKPEQQRPDHVWLSWVSRSCMAADILLYQPHFVPVGQDQSGARGTHARGCATIQLHL